MKPSIPRQTLSLAALPAAVALALALPAFPAAGDEPPADAKVERKAVRVIVRDGHQPEVTEIAIPPGAPDHLMFFGDDGETFELPTPPPGGGPFVIHPGGPRGYLGLQLTDLTPELRAHFRVPEGAGVLVGQVEEGSPAAAAGVRVGDVLTAVDGERMEDSRGVRRHVRGLEDGEAVALEVYRDGRRMALSATAAVREVPEVDARRFLWRTPAPDGEGPAWTVDREEIERAVGEMRERFAGPEFQGQMLRLKGLESDLERRIQELETKIRELEARLGG